MGRAAETEKVCLCDICGGIYPRDKVTRIKVSGADRRVTLIFVCERCLRREREAVDKYVKKAERVKG